MREYQYIGLDHVLIEQIFFATQIAKERYVAGVQKLLKDLSISEGDDRLDVLNKVGDAGSDLPLIPDIFAFSDNLSYSKQSERGNYYTDVKLCEYNIDSKRRASISDFAFEEQIFNRLRQSDLHGYARLHLTFRFGELYVGIDDSKRNYFFDQLRETTFDISAATVSEFYKLVAQVYLDINDKDKALDWFRAGVVLNPKLTVQKLIKQLEKQ